MKSILSRFGVFQKPVTQIAAEPSQGDDAQTASDAPIQRAATYPK
jgi:hypothetical protein